jgi:hypothetical protein
MLKNIPPTPEEEFRNWAFHYFFRKTFQDVHDPAVRFGKALEASARPIKNRNLMFKWLRTRKRCRNVDPATLSA